MSIRLDFVGIFLWFPGAIYHQHLGWRRGRNGQIFADRSLWLSPCFSLLLSAANMLPWTTIFEWKTHFQTSKRSAENIITRETQPQSLENISATNFKTRAHTKSQILQEEAAQIRPRIIRLKIVAQNLL